jgi:phosphate transport system substrate-binding protein
MKKNTLKIIISVLLSIIFFVAAFFVWIVSLFTGNQVFYSIIIPVTYISIIIFLVTWVLRNRLGMIISLITLAICLFAVFIQIQYSRYQKSIPVVKEEKVNLRDYRPFDDDSKIAQLDKKTSLSLVGSLPVIDGATALYPLYSAFVNATYPPDVDNQLDDYILCSTTSKAFENLINKKVDLIFCAEPSKEQIKLAKQHNIELKLISIGKEAFVFFVNKNNPVSNLTTDDIIGIYSGRITRWNDLGGINQTIKVFQRPQNSGSQTILQKIMGDTEIVKPLSEEVVDGMGGIISKTADYKNYKNSIGFSFLFYSTKMVNNGLIKLLSINNIYPSKESIQNGTYPYTSNFYAITRQDSTDEVKQLINWIISDEGQLLVEKTGYLPIK